jgi:hypothetical protein
VNGFAAIKAETASILTDTAEIGAAGAGLTAVPWNATWDAEVQSECADALTAYGASTVTTAQVNAQADLAISDWATTAIANAATLSSHTSYSPHFILLKLIKEIQNKTQSELSGSTRKDVLYDDNGTTAINSRILMAGANRDQNITAADTDITQLQANTI